MTHDFNSAAPIRVGEELPTDALAAYFQQQLPSVTGPLVVEQFPHGHSNLTYLLRMGQDDFVLRRPPFGNQVATAHDMGREYRILSRLNSVYPAAPKPLFYCEDTQVLGVPFYVMERRRGLILRKKVPPQLTITAAQMRQMSCTLINKLVELHQVDYQAAGLQELGKPEGYVSRQVGGWTKRYQQAKTSEIPEMEQVALWLNANQPTESGIAIVHNDFKYDNVMFAAEDFQQITAVLDWEMATLGDPLMDLGTSLGYWVQADDPAPFQQAAFGPTALPGSLTRREVVEHYQAQTGVLVQQPAFYYTFGLFKLAVIVQQIYARFARGLTKDPRFAQLDQLVKLLAIQADRTLQSGQV